MSETLAKYQVRIGQADGYRLVGVEPPLTENEVRNLEYAEVISPGSATQIEEPEPACTVISVSSEPGSSPETRTNDAHNIALKIALALNQWGEGGVYPSAAYTPEPVFLMGENSTPFNPET
jgi:hypothetical protein